MKVKQYTNPVTKEVGTCSYWAEKLGLRGEGFRDRIKQSIAKYGKITHACFMPKVVDMTSCKRFETEKTRALKYAGRTQKMIHQTPKIIRRSTTIRQTIERFKKNDVPPMFVSHEVFARFVR